MRYGRKARRRGPPNQKYDLAGQSECGQYAAATRTGQATLRLRWLYLSRGGKGCTVLGLRTSRRCLWGRARIANPPLLWFLACTCKSGASRRGWHSRAHIGPFFGRMSRRRSREIWSTMSRRGRSLKERDTRGSRRPPQICRRRMPGIFWWLSWLWWWWWQKIREDTSENPPLSASFLW